MVNYKDLGLVNTRELFKKAVKGGYAISYELTVKAKDANGTVYKEIFTLEIQLP